MRTQNEIITSTGVFCRYLRAGRMATEEHMDLSDRLYGEYRCSCGKRWKSIDASEEYQECRSCSEEAERVLSRPLRYSDIPEGRRLFGKFRCPKCSKSWNSGNSWKGYRQQCKSCKAYAEPYFLNFLEFQGDSGDLEKPHLQDLCEKCQKLGRNCRSEADDLADKMGRLHF